MHEDDSDSEGSSTSKSNVLAKTSVASSPADAGPVLVSTGIGVEELQQALDDTTVQWALLRVELGSGAFQRQKVLFLHLNGANCPAVRRGRLSERTVEVQNHLRGEEGFHASLVVSRAEEVTIDEIMSRVGHCFVADDLGNHAAGWKGRRTETSDSRALESLRSGKPDFDSIKRTRSCPGHESSNPVESGRDALRSMADGGPINWILLRPDPKGLPLVGSGTGSVDEMRTSLTDHANDVLFGVLRLSFGTGRLRRTKFALVYIVGRETSTMCRGGTCAVRPQMEQAVAVFVNSCTTMEIDSAEDFTLEAVIDRLQRSVIVDNEVQGDNAARQVYCIDAFRSAVFYMQ
jgi:hypothetical protein